MHEIKLVHVVDSLHNGLEDFNTFFHWSLPTVLVEPVLQGTRLAKLHSNVQVSDVIRRRGTRIRMIRLRRRTAGSELSIQARSVNAGFAFADRRQSHTVQVAVKSPLVEPRVVVTHNVRVVQRRHYLNLPCHSPPDVLAADK